ncbi:hypothetical protein P885DRAFT_80728 [Corynascus similis CBS 632.67]
MVSGSGTALSGWYARTALVALPPQQCTTTAQDTSGGDQPDEDNSSNNGHQIRRIRSTRWYLFRFYFKLVSAFPACVVDLEAKWEAWHKALSSSSEFVSRASDGAPSPLYADIQFVLSSPSTWASVPEHATIVALGPKAVPLVVWQVATHKDDATAVFLWLTHSAPADDKLEHDPEYMVNDGDPERTASLISEKNRNAPPPPPPGGLLEFEELVKLGPPVIPQLMLK